MAARLVHLSRSLDEPLVEARLPGVTFLHCTQVEVADRAADVERIWAGEPGALDQQGFRALLRRRIEEGYLDDEARWLFLRAAGELAGVAMSAPETPAGLAWTSSAPADAVVAPVDAVGRVRWLAVERSSRRRGFGRALLRRAMAILQQRGLRRCLVAVRRENDAGLALLRSEGFAPRASGNG